MMHHDISFLFLLDSLVEARSWIGSDAETFEDGQSVAKDMRSC